MEQRAMSEMEMRNQTLINTITSEFDRLNKIIRAEVVMNVSVENSTLALTFKHEDVEQSVTCPLPILTDNGLEIIENNEVVRAVGKYLLEKHQTILTYQDVMSVIFCGDISYVFPRYESGNSSFIHKIIRSFNLKATAYMVSQLQQSINEIVNMLPLHETDMNTWAMNNRLVIIDPMFDELQNPDDRLNYQVEKNKKYYKLYGWSSLGLSDGVLADENYILTVDLRSHIPFGQFHHPKRNLYSTLGMKGDELPFLRSKSLQSMISKGIVRKGWNMFTVALDLPLNFEDQILVDKRWAKKSHTVTRRYIVYGNRILVAPGDKVNNESILGIANNDEAVCMTMRCDEAVVKIVRPEVFELSGQLIDGFVITVEGRRYMRDGTKITNMHGNKGVIRLMDLGCAIDPQTGEEVPIDIIVSAKSIDKRGNFGQVVEMLASHMLDPDAEYHVVPDDYVTSKKHIEDALVAKGYPRDGAWMVHTYCGKYQAVCGKMFWGIIKDPEDQLWEGNRTQTTNNRELRTSGLKFSAVELSALVTRFGKNNPINAEIMSYAQGADILRDNIRILKSAAGEIDDNYPVLEVNDVPFVVNNNGIFHDQTEISGTVVDEYFMSEGFVLQLPALYQAIVPDDDLDAYTCGIPQEFSQPGFKSYTFDKIFIPNGLMRRCWRHPSGKWGLSQLGTYVNYIMQMCHNYLATEDLSDLMDMHKAITKYFSYVARVMGTKNGELSILGMSVRYPWSSRATVVLATNLPKDTVEIHRDMAEMLQVKHGDVVIGERFPCLGFVSIRPLFVHVTDDDACKYVIRVSGNTLNSMNLDFDGDTLFFASFHTAAAKARLRQEMDSPNAICQMEIQRFCDNKVPGVCEYTLDDYNLVAFGKPSDDVHADIVKKNTGVKAHTGPVIALAYNLMRMVEKNLGYADVKQHVELELLLDFLGNTVFGQKHGVESLQEAATDAICIADVETMVNLGFKREPSQVLCDLIRKEARAIGINDLADYHWKAKETGRSKIINRIVRSGNRLYFASRCKMGPYKLLDHLNSAPVDLPSYMFNHIIKTPVEKVEVRLRKLEQKRLLDKTNMSSEIKDVCEVLCEYVDGIMVNSN